MTYRVRDGARVVLCVSHWILDDYSDDFKQKRSAYRSRFGLPDSDDSYDYVDIRDPRLPEMLAWAAASRLERGLFYKSCWVEEPGPPSDDPHAWFALPMHEGTFRTPERTVPGMAVSYRDGAKLASETFRTVLERANLTGLEFIRLVDSRDSDPEPWYEIYATHPLGRGLDHPLNDPVILGQKKEAGDQSDRLHGLDPARRWGIETAWYSTIRENTEIDPPIFTQLALLNPNYFRIAGPQRFVREFLPSTDFAYAGWGWRERRESPTKARYRRIYCSARAKQALVDAGMFKPTDFSAVCVVAEQDAQTEILDRIEQPLPPPAFLPEEAAAERVSRDSARQNAVPRTPPTRFESTTHAMQVLEQRLAAGTAKWTPARDEPEFAEIAASEHFHRSPESWRTLAPLLPLSHHDQEREFYFAMCTPEWNQWPNFDTTGDPEDGPLPIDLSLACEPFGNWYAIRTTDAALPADAKVTLWDHETSSMSDAWPSVAAFAAHLVTMIDRAGGQCKEAPC